MIKKKGKSKTIAKKAAKKSGETKENSEWHPEEVRKEIAQLVQSEAKSMAQAVIGEGKKGQLAPVKYMFEMANIFPASTDGSQVTQDEECLAKTLLDRLKIPHEPAAQEDDEEETIVIPARVESADGDAPVQSPESGEARETADKP
jgi:hypothetical protein